MIFIPCRNGWSHRPDEYASPQVGRRHCWVGGGGGATCLCPLPCMQRFGALLLRWAPVSQSANNIKS